MAISSTDGFLPGADLWIAPERKSSGLTQRLDWYLNFQISKAAKHHGRELPQRVEELLIKCGLPHLDFAESDRDGLLVPSAHLLPNRWVLILRGSEQFDSWVQNIFLKWNQLAKPTLRVFLPSGKTLEEFQRAWRKISDFENFTVILDN